MGLIDDYMSAGLRLVPIPPGRKEPIVEGWNTRGGSLTSAELPPGYGVGLAHAYSGTMAFDIDDWFGTTLYGIDVAALYAAPDAVTILSGREGRGKLLYRMPPGLVLPSKQFYIRVPGGPTPSHTKRHMLFELRCGTTNDRTVQDVLPPSIHPGTQRPYEWGGAGHWSRPPLIPQQLMDIWQEAIRDIRPVRVDGVDSSWDEIKDAIEHIHPDCPREDWINVGMGLHWAGEQTLNNDQAFHVWNEWSSKGVKYPGERGVVQQWNSFRTDKASTITLGTVFHLARQSGWVRPTPDAATLFSRVAPATPVDIGRILRPAPPPVDLNLWPAQLAKRSQEVSDGVGCDPLVPLWAGLAAVCGVIDARTRLELMPGFKVPPVLWLMTMGEPADKKSPGSRPMLEPLAEIEAADRPRYRQELLAWEVTEAAYSKAKKALLDFAGSHDHQLGGEAPEVPPLPNAPVPVKITVSDITSQKLVRQGADRPRGLLCYLDEMNSWVKKMTNTMSGEDRSCWVVSYEATRYEMDRVNTGSIHAENLAVSIYGNIQPRVFSDNFNNLAQDGLIQRFLPAVLRPEQTRLGTPVPDELTSLNEWSMLLRTVYALPPVTYRLSPEAYIEYRAFQEWYEQRKVNERLVNSSATYMTAYGKLEGLAGRLALVFHAIESPFNQEVSGDVMTRVINIIKGYVIPVYRHLYDTEETSSSVFDQWVVDYIIQHADLPGMSLKDIRRGARRQLERAGIKHLQEQIQWVVNSMSMLELVGWVARVDDGANELKGQASWLINPHIKEMFSDYRKAVIRARIATKQEIAENGGIRFIGHPHGADDLD